MRPLLLLAVLALAPARAAALATESFGNAPIGPGFIPNETLPLVNLPSRVYWYEVNGNPTFFFRGGVPEVNAALAKFATLKDPKKEIRLVPGPHVQTSLTRDKSTPVDWSLHTPAGLHAPEDDRAVFTIYVTVPKPPAAADAATVAALVADLDSPQFATRDAASKELAKYGHAVGEAMKAARAATASAEVRGRLDELLGKLKGIDAARLELPAGVPVLGPADLLARFKKELTDKDSGVRGRAVMRVCAADADPAEILPLATEFLKAEKHEYALRCASSAAYHLGADAAPLLPLLKEHAKSADENVRRAYEQAVAQVEKAKPTPADEAKRKQALRADIAAFLAGRK